MTSQETVKQIYPEAYCVYWANAWDDGYIVIVPLLGDFAGGDSRIEAWDNAAKRIKNLTGGEESL